MKVQAMQRLVLATDFSPASDRAVELARRIAVRTGAHLDFVHVITVGFGAYAHAMNPELLVAVRHEARRRLDALVMAAASDGILAAAEVLEGGLWKELLAYGHQIGADCLVVGSRGRSEAAHLAMGSAAERIFRHAAIPVLIAGPGSPAWLPGRGLTFLHASNFGEHAAHTAKVAAGMARTFGARLVLMHALPDARPNLSAGQPGQDECRQALRNLLPPAAACECVAEVGPPVETIVAAAAACDAALLIIGANRQSTMPWVALETTAYRLVAEAGRPVLVVPPPVVPASKRLSKFASGAIMLGAAVFLLLSALALAPQAAPSQAPGPLDGPGLFHAWCASCHGADAKGGGPVAPVLAIRVPDLTLLSRRNGGVFPAERVRHIIAGDEMIRGHGNRVMPIWGPIFHQIDNDQDWGNIRLDSLTKYLQSIQQP